MAKFIRLKDSQNNELIPKIGVDNIDGLPEEINEINLNFSQVALEISDLQGITNETAADVRHFETDIELNKEAINNLQSDVQNAQMDIGTLNDTSHSHGNKAVLDTVTATVVSNSHTHANKTVIDGIAAANVTNWNTASTNQHTHANKAVLDTLTAAVVTNSHTHSNKAVLDGITATNVTSWNNAANKPTSTAGVIYHTNKIIEVYGQTTVQVDGNGYGWTYVTYPSSINFASVQNCMVTLGLWTEFQNNVFINTWADAGTNMVAIYVETSRMFGEEISAPMWYRVIGTIA